MLALRGADVLRRRAKTAVIFDVRRRPWRHGLRADSNASWCTRHAHVSGPTRLRAARIRSDLAIWHAHVTARAPTLAAAYEDLARRLPRVRAHLEHQGVAPGEIVTSAVVTREWHPRDARGIELEDHLLRFMSLRSTNPERDAAARVWYSSGMMSELPRVSLLLCSCLSTFAACGGDPSTPPQHVVDVPQDLSALDAPDALSPRDADGPEASQDDVAADVACLRAMCPASCPKYL